MDQSALSYLPSSLFVEEAEEEVASDGHSLLADPFGLGLPSGLVFLGGGVRTDVMKATVYRRLPDITVA